MLGQVRIFHCADADSVGYLPQLPFVQIRVFAFNQAVGTLLGFIEQVDQLHGAAITGFEGAAICTVHGAEAHMLELHVAADEVSAPGHLEGHLEMQRLALIDKIQRAIGLELLTAVAHGRQVGSRVEVATAGFLHNHRERVAFGVLEFIEKNALGAVAFAQQTFGLERRDYIGKFGVVGAFAFDVFRGEADVEAVIDLLRMAE